MGVKLTGPEVMDRSNLLGRRAALITQCYMAHFLIRASEIHQPALFKKWASQRQVP